MKRKLRDAEYNNVNLGSVQKADMPFALVQVLNRARFTCEFASIYVDGIACTAVQETAIFASSYRVVRFFVPNGSLHF